MVSEEQNINKITATVGDHAPDEVLTSPFETFTTFDRQEYEAANRGLNILLVEALDRLWGMINLVRQLH